MIFESQAVRRGVTGVDFRLGRQRPLLRGDFPGPPPGTHHDHQKLSGMPGLSWRVPASRRVDRGKARQTLHHTETLHNKPRQKGLTCVIVVSSRPENANSPRSRGPGRSPGPGRPRRRPRPASPRSPRLPPDLRSPEICVSAADRPQIPAHRCGSGPPSPPLLRRSRTAASYATASIAPQRLPLNPRTHPGGRSLRLPDAAGL